MTVAEVLIYGDNQLKLVVKMGDHEAYTTHGCPHVVSGVFQLFPYIRRHVCENDFGHTFEDEARTTEVPHLFEHLILEIQSQVQCLGTLKGETQWDWHIDPRGTFHVHLEFEDEQLALGSIRLAEKIIHYIDNNNIDSLDMEAEMARLRVIARIDGWHKTMSY